MSIILRNLELFCNHSQKVDIVKTCQNNTSSLVDVIFITISHTKPTDQETSYDWSFL